MADLVLRFESPDTIWQAARLANLALPHLPARTEAVALLDADIRFLNPLWAEESLEMVRAGTKVLMPFSTCSYGELGPTRPSTAARLRNQGDLSAGHPGLALVVAKPVLDACPLYDLSFAGNNDSVVVLASLGMDDHTFFDSYGGHMAEDMRAWAAKWLEAVDGPALGLVKGHVNHMWHGPRMNRQYVVRRGAVAALGARPSWFSRKAGQPLCWSSRAPGAAKSYMVSYFAQRNEDDPETPDGHES
jgi:hypothetical protein